MALITKIWMILSVFTLFAFLVGWLKLTSLTLIAILLITTFIKGQLVIDYFMDLHEVTLKYRIIPTIWLFIIILSIGIIYYFPKEIIL